MALVLPILRLWLLLLNIYGTFKAIKPPPSSQRNTRNGSGPSTRAMQLRKRELKSRLAVWVVWATFTILEFPLDFSIGFVMPFYNELKCIILLFLLVSRVHGAEAIFLHLIHPSIRPYVPAIDDILASLNLVFDLLTLLFLLPWEYLTHYWRAIQRWSRTDGTSTGDTSRNNQSDAHRPADPGEDQPDIRRRLGPRMEANQTQLIEAARQAQAILQNIDDAQEKVRTRNIEAGSRTRSEQTSGKRGTSPDTLGLRTRRRVLEQQQQEFQPQLHSLGNRGPGSILTGLHYLDSASLTPPNPRLPASLPERANHTIPHPTAPNPLPSPPPSGYRIWYRPQSSHDRSSPPPRNHTHRTPSPVYPPFPSAYPFTPRRSDPLPLPPHVTKPPEIVTPVPRRVSSGVVYKDPGEDIDPISNHAGPSTARSPLPHPYDSREEFFGQALGPSIQTVDMDLDTETLSTRDGSSAEEESTEEKGEARQTLQPAAEVPTTGQSHAQRSKIRNGKRKTSTTHLRRSTRIRNERPSSIETDEFGFAIHPDSLVLETTSIDSESSSSRATSTAEQGPKKKKPLARTKPALKSTPEEAIDMTSSDEESVKKKRKIRPIVGDSNPPTGGPRNQLPVESKETGKTKKTTGSATVRNVKNDAAFGEDRQTGSRPVRASTRPPRPISAQGQVGGEW